MTVSCNFVIFIIVHIILICHSPCSISVSANEIGVSSCWIKGGYVEHCSDKFALIGQFPKECTSYFINAIIVDMDRNVNGVYGKGTEAVLNDLIYTGKPVYVTYVYLDIKDFFLTIESIPFNQTYITKEMENLQAYLSQHQSIAGLSVSLSLTPETLLPMDFSQKLRAYLNVLKNSLPYNMEIGLSFPAYYFQDVYKNSMDCMIQFQVINDIVDFYVVYAYALNDKCSAGFISGGQTPVNGGAENTLEKLQCLLNDAGMLKNKLQYLFVTYPTDSTEGDICSMNYYEMCKHPDSAKEWCADNLESFYEKGQFVSQNANGFISGHLDLDDPKCICKCGHPFPAFYAILNGFNGDPPPDSCPLFDRM